MNILKLTSPLSVSRYNSPYGDYGSEISAEEAVAYEQQILGEIKHSELPGELVRGLMAYFCAEDDPGVNEKVISARPTVEIIDGKLTGVCYCAVNGKLTTGELDKLIEYISGQYSDGWGEGLEQREIPVESGYTILVSFWSPDDNWDITPQHINNLF